MTPPAAATAAGVRARPRSATARPLTAPRTPRRVSGPARRGSVARPSRSAQRRPQTDGAAALGLLGRLDGLSRHRLLDRLIRGRVWIALVAFALLGIVTLQLGLLKLNAGIGRALEHAALLQRENAALSIENSELAGGDRVESRAARMGMELVPLGALRFLAARPGADAARAAAALKASAQSSSSGAAEASSGAAEASSAGVAASSGAAEASSGASAAAGAVSPQAGEQTSGSAASGSASAASPGTPDGEAASGPGASAPAAASAPASAGTSQPGSPQSSPSGPAPAAPAEASPAGGTQAGSTG